MYEETIDTLNLEIAQLEHQLDAIEQELATSAIDPHHRDTLILNSLKVQAELDKLIRQKQILGPHKKEGWPLHQSITWLVL